MTFNVVNVELILGAWLDGQAPFFFHVDGSENGIRFVFRGE